MRFFNFILLFNLFQALIASNSSPRMNYTHGIRNFGFKAIIFKEKKYPKIAEYIKQQYKNYYDRYMVAVGERIIEYENLSHEEKELIELILSSIFN